MSAVEGTTRDQVEPSPPEWWERCTCGHLALHHEADEHGHRDICCETVDAHLDRDIQCECRMFTVRRGATP